MECDVPPPYEQCPDTCGDGEAGACIEQFVEEDCDGLDLAGQSCATLGFLGGELGCQSNCEFDTTQCERCAAPDGLVSACEPAPVSTRQPWSLDIAASDSGFAMAWVGANAGEQVELVFARFASDLSPLIEPVVVPADCASQVALAAVEERWFLAQTSDAGVALTVVDDSGAIDSARVLDTGSKPQIAAGAQEGALVVWGKNGSLYALLLDDDANETTEPKLLPFGTNLQSYDYDFDMVRAGDGYLIATRVDKEGVQLVRVEPDGSFGPVFKPVLDESELPRLASMGDEVRMTYSDFSGGLGTSGPRRIRLTTEGEAASPVTELGNTPDYYGPTAHAILGGESVVLLAGHTGITNTANLLDVSQVTADGVLSMVPQRLATDPSHITQVRTAVVDGGVIVAWLNGRPTTITYARLEP